MRKLNLILSVAAAAVLLTGCSTSTAPAPAPTQKQVVTKSWNDARSAVLISLAHDEYNNNALDKSRSTIDQALKLSPDSAPAHILSAKLYMEAGQLELAERDLDAARLLDPTAAEPEYLSGVVYQRWEQPEKALDFYQRACDKSPAELAYVLARAEMLVAMNRSPQALAFLQEKVAYFEHSGVIRDEVGLLLMQQGRTAEAVEMLRRGTILAPDEPTIREHLAMALYANHSYGDCEQTLNVLLKDPDYENRPDLHLTLGQCQAENNEPTPALQNLQQASQTLSSSPGLWLSMARVDLQLGDVDHADAAVRRALALDGQDSQVFLLLGYVRLQQNMFQQALDAFTRAHELSPRDTVSLCMMGLAQQKLGRATQAVACYRRALKIDANDQMAAQLMARLDSHE